MNKPYSESCDQNRDPILSVISPLLKECASVFEIGSGTGQHAIYFAQKMPHLVWHTSDLKENLPGINSWLDDASLPNITNPVELDVSSANWPGEEYDAIFSANTSHIMHWPDVESMFSGCGSILKTGGKFMLYGPFNYDHKYTSESNRRFDQWLKSRDAESGIRDFEALNILAEQAGLMLQNDFEMPANNRLLYWAKYQ